MTIQKNIKLIQSAETHKESIIEFTIIPGERTPWHYHTLFSETFEILAGTLEAGKNGKHQQLYKGDVLTIKPKEKHYYHNISEKDCIIKVILNPANRGFEKSLLILKGLTKDGLTSAAGMPKKVSDLSLFLYLNNSKAVGFQKIAQPLFNFLAKRGMRKGRLQELEESYCDI